MNNVANRADGMGGLLDFLLDGSGKFADLSGRTCGLIGKRFNLVGNHGKALAKWSGTFGFDCRIKRQKLGAVGNIVDQIND